MQGESIQGERKLRSHLRILHREAIYSLRHKCAYSTGERSQDDDANCTKL